MAKSGKGKNSFFYILIFLIFFLISAFLGYLFVSKNGGAIIETLFPKPEESSVSSEIESSFESSLPATAASGPYIHKNNLTTDRAKSEITTKYPEVNNDYFENTFFIGDSLTTELADNTYFTYDNVLALNGMTIADFFSFQAFDSGASTSMLVTMADALSTMQEPPERIYIMLGMSDLDNSTIPQMILDYEKILDYIKGLFPDVEIIVEAILPFTEAYAKENTGIRLSDIEEFNLALLDLCITKKAYFIDFSEELKTTNGYLADKYAATDGFHLSMKGYEAWELYLKTHFFKDPSVK